MTIKVIGAGLGRTGTMSFKRAMDILGWEFSIATNDIQVSQIGFIGIVGVVTMAGAVTLTIYSLAQYLLRYGGLFAHRADHNRG